MSRCVVIQSNGHIREDCDSGRMIDCPLANFADCRANCAFFSLSGQDGNTEEAYCKDYCIGIVTKNEYEPLMQVE